MNQPDERMSRVRALILQEDAVGDQDGVVEWLHRLCTAAARALPASGAGVSLMTAGGIRGVAAASDEVSEALEELQFTLGEGPCIDAFASGRPVLEPDLGNRASTRWAGYAPAATARGVRGVFAFPLAVGAAQLGVLDVYREQPGSLSNTSFALALTFADVAVETLLDAQDSAPSGQAADGLDQAMGSHYVIYQAQGMTMVDLGVPLADAMAVLRAHAYANDRSLRAVADEIVAGTLRLGPHTS